MTMPRIDLRLDGDGAASDITPPPVDVGNAFRMIGLDGGMSSGAASVAFVVPTPDGGYVLVQTSLSLLNAAVSALNARYPGPLNG